MITYLTSENRDGGRYENQQEYKTGKSEKGGKSDTLAGGSPKREADLDVSDDKENKKKEPKVTPFPSVSSLPRD